MSRSNRRGSYRGDVGGLELVHGGRSNEGLGGTVGDGNGDRGNCAAGIGWRKLMLRRLARLGMAEDVGGLKGRGDDGYRESWLLCLAAG